MIFVTSRLECVGKPPNCLFARLLVVTWPVSAHFLILWGPFPQIAFLKMECASGDILPGLAYRAKGRFIFAQTSWVPPLGHGHVPATWHLIRSRVWPQADQTLTKFTKPSNSYSLLCSLQFRCLEGSDHLGMCQTRGSFKLAVFLLCRFKCSDGFCQHKRRLRQVGGCQKYGPLFGPCFVFLSAGSTSTLLGPFLTSICLRVLISFSVLKGIYVVSSWHFCQWRLVRVPMFFGDNG